MINQSVNYTVHDFRIKTKSYEQYNMGTNHFHNSYEIYYLNAGTRDYFINDKTYHVKPGNLVLIKPYILHKTMDTGERHSRLLISFKPNYLPFKAMDNLLENLFTNKHVISFDTNMRSKIESTFTKMIKEITDKTPHYEASLQAHLLRLLIDVNCYIHKPDKDAQEAPSINDKIYEIVQYLNENYTKKIVLDDLSEQFFISRYYLSHTFKKITGFTIVNFIQNLRIMKSQQLLCETDMKIIEISEAVGFTNISNFGKTFKTITGVSPKNYKNKEED